MRRRTAAACVVTLLAAGALAGCGGGSKKAAAPPARCDTSTPAPPKRQQFTAAPDPKSVKKSYTVSFETTCGTIKAKLLPKEAPATVASFDFLAGEKYFDGTFCHRATQTASLTVLQCGDPTGVGAGSPGYTLPEENLPAPGPDPRFAIYPRGTLAMARKREPHTGGSQFFLVARDSTLPPDYTIFGVVTAGVEVLDAVLALGIDDADSDISQGLDGAPRSKVFLKSVRVTAK